MISFLSSNLFQRIASAVVLMPLVLLAVWIGGPIYTLVVVLMMMAGLYEWLGMTAPALSQRGKTWAYGSTLFVLAVAVTKGVLPAIGLALFASAILIYYARKTGHGARAALWVGAGIPYMFFSALALIFLRSEPEYGPVFMIYLLAIVWGTDTGAYAAGRLIGGPKICPQISPKKTWAGLVGGMAAAALLGYFLSSEYVWPLGVPFSPFFAAGLGIALAVIAQAGDFFESHVKRRAGVKDSGRLIPGHGGLLDRVDGLLFAAIALALFVVIKGSV